jgi:NAD+ diphosphatase
MLTQRTLSDAATFEGSNYFSGSPLNRVAFLRSDHNFLSYAFRHPSTTFILFNNLAPFITSPSSLAYASYGDVRPLIGEDPFAKSEADMLREFNSEITTPLVLFLGLDEKRDGGVEWGSYKGAPRFAVDITPRGPLKDGTEELMREMEARGWKLLKGRVNFLDAPQGIFENFNSLIDDRALR